MGGRGTRSGARAVGARDDNNKNDDDNNTDDYLSKHLFSSKRHPQNVTNTIPHERAPTPFLNHSSHAPPSRVFWFPNFFSMCL